MELTAMKVAVISDLHLGNAGASDIFGHDDAEFLKFLSYRKRFYLEILFRKKKKSSELAPLFYL